MGIIHKYKELDIELLKKLYLIDKLSCKEIANKFNCSGRMIEYRFKKNKVCLRNQKEVFKIKRENNRMPKKRLVNYDKICSDYIKNPESSSVISKRWNVSPGTICRILKDNKIKKKWVGDFTKERIKTNGHPMQGKHHTEEVRNRLNIIQNTKEYKDKMRKMNLGDKNPFFKKNHTQESIEKIRQASIKMWSNEEKKKEITKKVLHSLFHVHPSSYEKMIADLCFKYNLPFIYTGDGKFLISYNKLVKNPDFIDENNKIAIEVFYSGFKIRDYGSIDNYKKHCESIYNPLGWKVIYIDETDIKDNKWEEKCLQKIREVI